MNMKYFKKFCIYFIAIFTIAVVCGFTGLVIKEVDNGTFYDLDTIEALGFCVQLRLTAFTSLIPYSLSVATFPGLLGYGQRKVDWLFPYIGNGVGFCNAFVGNDLLL